MKILLATANLGKLKEMKALFDNFDTDIELLTLNDFPKISEPIEDGSTFLANAYIKVMYYYNAFKVPTISDDTGLLVDALNGEPGVRTARYGSVGDEHADPVKNYMLLLKNLEGIKQRSARFRTAMFFYDGNVLISSVGEMEGSIADEPDGINGFGYDPVFYLDEYGCTVAKLEDGIKNKISHRAKASASLVTQLKRYLKK